MAIRGGWMRPNISIHAPRTGSDPQRRALLKYEQAFQSTLPARGATHRRLPSAQWGIHFNPRSPHGERPAAW